METIRIHIFLALLLSVFIYVACGSSTSQGTAANLTGFTSINIPGSDAVMATKKDASGKLIEQGILRNGIKDGPWTVFHDNEGVKSITGYVNGKLNGAHLEFNNRTQLEKRVEYLDNQYHGLYGEYKYGRPLKEITYDNGIQEGPFRIWNDMGILKQRGQNKNGKLHGTLQYYDDDENLVMKYEYENGEQISGGMINAGSANE